jgi:hypothetical protein
MTMTLRMIPEMRRTIRLNLEDGVLTMFRIHYQCNKYPLKIIHQIMSSREEFSHVSN